MATPKTIWDDKIARCKTVKQLVEVREAWDASNDKDRGPWDKWTRRLCRFDADELVECALKASENLSGRISPELRDYLPDAALYALAMLWWERSTRRGTTPPDTLSEARDAWARIAYNHVCDWWAPRLAAAAWVLEALGAHQSQT